MEIILIVAFLGAVGFLAHAMLYNIRIFSRLERRYNKMKRARQLSEELPARIAAGGNVGPLIVGGHGRGQEALHGDLGLIGLRRYYSAILERTLGPKASGEQEGSRGR